MQHPPMKDIVKEDDLMPSQFSVIRVKTSVGSSGRSPRLSGKMQNSMIHYQKLKG